MLFCGRGYAEEPNKLSNIIIWRDDNTSRDDNELVPIPSSFNSFRIYVSSVFDLGIFEWNLQGLSSSTTLSTNNVLSPWYEWYQSLINYFLSLIGIADNPSWHRRQGGKESSEPTSHYETTIFEYKAKVKFSLLRQSSCEDPWIVTWTGYDLSPHMLRVSTVPTSERRIRRKAEGQLLWPLHAYRKT